MARKDDLLQNLMRPKAAADTAPVAAQPSYDISTTSLADTPETMPLPPDADALPPPLRELALRYLGAKRRIGDALLESAKWMSAARDLAEEGQWYLFLQVTQTSPDSAEILINIHVRATQYPMFANAIRRGWFNQTVAGELARPSSPPELVDQLLQGERPPRVADVKRARREQQQSSDISHNVDNPNYSGSAETAPVLAAPNIGETGEGSDHAPLLVRLQEIATNLAALVSQADQIPSGDATVQALDQAEQALAAIRQALGR